MEHGPEARRSHRGLIGAHVYYNRNERLPPRSYARQAGAAELRIAGEALSNVARLVAVTLSVTLRPPVEQVEKCGSERRWAVSNRRRMSMKPKQVFRAYRGAVSDPAAFCLRCGAELSDREEGGRIRRACASCGFVHYANPAAGVAVLIVDGNRVLLCRRQADVLEGGKWCLPCGYVEYDEDYLTAAHREVREETGLAVEIRGIISVCSNFLRPQVHTVVTVLLATPVGGEPTPGDDIELVRWFPSAGTLPDMAFEADRHIITRFFASRLEGAPVDGQYARLTLSPDGHALERSNDE